MKTVIFDFDGVIHDTFELSYRSYAEVSGKNHTEDDFRNFFDGNVYERTRLSDNERKMIFELQNSAFQYFEMDKHVKNNLEKLSRAYHMYIISSNQEETLNKYFHKNNFAHVFREILGSETHLSKVAKFEHLFKKYRLEAKDCFFVTDTLGDILEGKKVGVEVIAVDFGFHKRERLEKGEPFKIVSSFDEVLEVIHNA